MEEEGLLGRVSTFTVTNVSQFAITPSKDRVKIVFLCPIVQRISWIPQDTTAVDGTGISLTAPQNSEYVVGQLAKMGWACILSAAVPTVCAVIEYFRSDYGKKNGN